MIDIYQTPSLEIHISADGKKVWINTEEGCQLRAYRIEQLVLKDDRNLLQPGETH